MSDINDQSVDQSINDDLDVFSDEFFGRKSQADIQSDSDNEQAKSVEQDDEDQDEGDANTEVEDDTQPDDADAEDDPEDKTEEVEKPKGRAKDRIVELNTKFREAERREQAALARIAELEKTLKPTDDQTKDTKSASEANGPTPTDTNEDGSEKYPLGEFDPNFIRDLTRFTIAQERTEAEKTSQAERQRQEQERQQAALNEEWENKLTPARERYPDFQEKAESLVDVFSGLDEQYGEFLAQTIMSMDNGTDVLYYLSNNHDEAQKIVQSGATKAAIALGRISLKVEEPVREEPKQRTTKAPPPPPTNKGSASSKPAVADDTDDLEAFEKKFFDKRRR